MPDLSRSRAILIGTASYQDPGFTPLPAAANSLAGMQQTLTNPHLCGWSSGRVTVLENPTDMRQVAQTLRREARSTDQVLLVYFAGHGVILPRGQLGLALSDTDAENPDITGLAYQIVREALLDSPAQVKIVILDCCYSGRAIETQSAGIADLTDTQGAYTLTASDLEAHVLPLPQQANTATSFTAEFLHLIRTGIPGGAQNLTFADIYPHLRHRLHARNLPAPNQRGTDTATLFPFTRNAANPPSPDPAATRHQESQATFQAPPQPAAPPMARPHHAGATIRTDQALRMLRDAEQTARRIGSSPQDFVARTQYQSVTPIELGYQYVGAAEALTEIAAVATRVNPAQAARLLDDAQSVLPAAAERGASEPLGSFYADLFIPILTKVAQAVAQADPATALSLLDGAQRIPHPMPALIAAIAEATAGIDPSRAEQIARNIPDRDMQAMALGRVAVALAFADSRRAEQIARSFTRKLWSSSNTNKYWAARSLAAIAAATEFIDYGRSAQLLGEAEKIAERITANQMCAEALAWVAAASARIDDFRRSGKLLTQAEQYATQAITEPSLVDTVHAVALTDAALAERIARSSTSAGIRAGALARVAITVARTNPAQAEQIAPSIASDIPLLTVAETAASTDSICAERIARGIANDFTQAKALAQIAEKAAKANPNQAARLLLETEQIAQSYQRRRQPQPVTGGFASGGRIAVAQRQREEMKESLLVYVAAAAAKAEPPRAEPIARNIKTPRLLVRALALIADAWLSP